MADILILNGPNLNMLGTREPEIYGAGTLADLDRLCQDTAARLGFSVECRQSNQEGELVTWIQQAKEQVRGLVINAAAYTHSSVAIHDALKILDPLPVIEVHLSNPHRREEFRHISYISPVASGVIAGFGQQGYVMALEQMCRLIGG